MPLERQCIARTATWGPHHLGTFACRRVRGRTAGPPSQHASALAIEADLKVLNNSGKVLLDLVEAGRNFTCSIELETGVATLSIDGGNVTFDTTTNNDSTFSGYFFVYKHVYKDIYAALEL